MDQNMMAQLLKQRADNLAQQGKATDQAQIFGQQFQNPNFTIGTPGFSTNINGHQAQMPGEVQVNYGDIVGKGISNYMQAKGMKDARELKAKGDQLNQAFMQDSLGNDEQAQKLYQASQAGIAGAGQALIQHLAPKKEAMAGMIQGVTSGMLDPEMAAQMAPKYGLSPDIVRQAASHAQTIKEQQEKSKIDGKTTLQTLKDEGAMARTQAQITSKEGIAATNNLAKVPRETEAQKLEARRNSADIEALPHFDNAISRMKDIVNLADEAKYLPLNMGLAPDAVNPKGVMLKQAMAGIVLDALGGKLGAGISNADVSFVKEAQANLDRGNRETAVAQFKLGIERLQEKRDAILKRQGKSTNVDDGTAQLPKSQYDSTAVKQRAGASAMPSFDDIMKDFE